MERFKPDFDLDKCIEKIKSMDKVSEVNIKNCILENDLSLQCDDKLEEPDYKLAIVKIKLDSNVVTLIVLLEPLIKKYFDIYSILQWSKSGEKYSDLNYLVSNIMRLNECGNPLVLFIDTASSFTG